MMDDRIEEYVEDDFVFFSRDPMFFSLFRATQKENGDLLPLEEARLSVSAALNEVIAKSEREMLYLTDTLSEKLARLYRNKHRMTQWFWYENCHLIKKLLIVLMVLRGRKLRTDKKGVAKPDPFSIPHYLIKLWGFVEEFIKNVYPTVRAEHQELLNATNPDFLALFLMKEDDAVVANEAKTAAEAGVTEVE